eukprot:3139681-Rhodomonas_salina.2
MQFQDFLLLCTVEHTKTKVEPSCSIFLWPPTRHTSGRPGRGVAAPHIASHRLPALRRAAPAFLVPARHFPVVVITRKKDDRGAHGSCLSFAAS